jgi:hypothetical protein
MSGFEEPGNSRWLPEGHSTRWDLHIYQRQLEDAGDFTAGQPKMILHTCECRFDQVDSMLAVLRDKRAAPTVLYGLRPGVKHPIVFQCVPFDQAARALAHPPGTPETNRAHCTQIEICGYARDSWDWPEDYYKGLANLCVLIEHRTDIIRKNYHDFGPSGSVKRLTPTGFTGCSYHSSILT